MKKNCTQQALDKKAGSVLKWSFLLRIKFSGGRQFSASKSASSPSAKRYNNFT